MSESFLPYADGMYHLAAGTLIYRGDSDLIRSATIPSTPVYYTIIDRSKPEQIESLENAYGIVHEYRANRDVKLLAVDHISEETYNKFPEDIQSILDNQFGYKNESFGYDPTRKRDSVASEDKKLVDYLCKHGYDGYAANDMIAIDEPILYQELVLCNPQNTIEYVQQLTNPDDVDRLHEKHVRIMKDKEMKENRRNTKKVKKEHPGIRLHFSPTKSSTQKKRLKYSPKNKQLGSPIVKNLFGSPEKDSSPISKNLFGSPEDSSPISKNLFDSPEKSYVSPTKSSLLKTLKYQKDSPAKKPVNRKLFGGKRKTRKQK